MSNKNCTCIDKKRCFIKQEYSDLVNIDKTCPCSNCLLKVVCISVCIPRIQYLNSVIDKYYYSMVKRE